MYKFLFNRADNAIVIGIKKSFRALELKMVSILGNNIKYAINFLIWLNMLTFLQHSINTSFLLRTLNKKKSSLKKQDKCIHRGIIYVKRIIL